MALTLSLACKNLLINEGGFASAFNSGTLKIFTGNSPGVEAGATGTEIFTISPTFTSAGTGKVSINKTGLIINNGTAGYFRLSGTNGNPYSDANGTAVRADGTCGLTTDYDMVLVGLAFTSGQDLTIQGNFNIP